MIERNELSRRHFLLATGGTAAAAALAGCSGDSNENGNNESNGSSQGTQKSAAGDGTGSNPSEGDGNQSGKVTTEKGPGKSDRIYRLISPSLTSFDPVSATALPSIAVIMNIFDALTNYPSGKVAVENLLATGYETSSDGKKYTLTLKDGVKFSNGETLSASDFVYSFERLAASEHTQRSGFLLDDLGVKHETDSEGNYKSGTLAVSAEDEQTLSIELSEGNPAVLEIVAYSAFAAVPEGIVGDIEGENGKMSYEKFATSNPVGAGPYTLETWKSGTEAKISARNDYHGKGPMTAGTHWQIVEESNAQYTYSVLNRNTDTPTVPNAQYDPDAVTVEGENESGYGYGTYQLENGLSADLYRTELLSTYYYGFNCRAVPQYVRKAVAYANNNQEIIDEVFKTPSKAAYNFVPPKIYPGGRSAYEKHAKKYPYGYKEAQLDKARQIMEENGHGPNNLYTFTMTVTPSNTWNSILNILRDKLRSAHIQMKIKSTTASTLFEQVYSGNTEAYRLSWFADWPSASNFLKILYPPSTDTSSDENLTGFNWLDSNPANRAASAWESIQSNPRPEADKQARNKASVSMLEAVWDGVPVIPITHSISTFMEYPWVHKPRIGAMGLERQKHNLVEIGERKA